MVGVYLIGPLRVVFHPWKPGKQNPVRDKELRFLRANYFA
jgi:hypothetical protein